MKDIFDYFEETYDITTEIYIIKAAPKNKKGRILYFSGVILFLGQIIWSYKKEDAKFITPIEADYRIIKSMIRNRGIRCEIIIKTKPDLRLKTVRWKKWWDQIREWYERYV